MSDELLDAIEANTTKPQAVTVDGTSATQFSLQDQIAVHKYVRANEVTADPVAAMRGMCLKIVPPGAF